MNKKEANNILKDKIGIFLNADLVTDLLYNNGLEVVIKSHPPKSRFMEEWGEIKESGKTFTEFYDAMMELIDKYKADK